MYACRMLKGWKIEDGSYVRKFWLPAVCSSVDWPFLHHSLQLINQQKLSVKKDLSFLTTVISIATSRPTAFMKGKSITCAIALHAILHETQAFQSISSAGNVPVFYSPKSNAGIFGRTPTQQSSTTSHVKLQLYERNKNDINEEHRQDPLTQEQMVNNALRRNNNRAKFRRKRNNRRSGRNGVYKAVKKNINGSPPNILEVMAGESGTESGRLTEADGGTSTWQASMTEMPETSTSLHSHEVRCHPLDRYNYLISASRNLLDRTIYPPGSLIKGKWHELKSIIVAWSKYMNSEAYPLAIKYSNTLRRRRKKHRNHGSEDEAVAEGIPEDPTELPLLVESLMSRFVEERSAGNEDVILTTQMYNVILEVWWSSISNMSKNTITKKHGNFSNDFDRTKNMKRLDLKSMGLKQKYSKGGGDNGAMYMVAAQRSLDIVKQMQEEHERENFTQNKSKDHGSSDSHNTIKPNFFSFLIVLKMWAKASALNPILPHRHNVSRHQASLRAHQTLLWMEHLSSSGRNRDVKPNVLIYTLVMDAYAKSGEKDAGSKAEGLLREMIATSKLKEVVECDNEDEARIGASSSDLQPNLCCYNMVINAYTRQGNRGGAVDHAERILHELEQTYQSTSNPALKPDVITYTSLMTAWANSNRRGYGANRAEEILVRMMEKGCKPNTVSFNAVLKAWCRSGERNAAERALRVFNKMKEISTGDVKPDRITYNTLIHTLSKSGKASAMIHAERILSKMEAKMDASADKNFSPNLFSYNTVIEGWSKVRDQDGSSRAYSMLKQMINNSKNSGSGILPDSFSFNNVIFALSRSGLKSSALRAEELLQIMQKEYESGNKRLKPDVFAYSSAIHAWANSGDKEAGERAEALLNRMEDMHAAGEVSVKPNTITFNSCIDCWAKSGQGILGARKSEQLLERMERMSHEGGDVKPTAHTYNGVLLAWAKSNSTCAHLKTQKLLDRMWKEYTRGNSDLRPDALSYNTVINALSRSQREDKAQKALRVLRTMDKLYRAGKNNARPNEFTYTSVLNSCAFTIVDGQDSSKVRRKALSTAIFTLEELQGSSYGSPNHVTYGMFLKACANLIPSDDEMRRIVVEPAFLQCCKDGQVGEIVLKQLRYAAPEDLYQKLLGDLGRSGTTVRFEDLPIAWRCNVRNEKRFRERKKPWKNQDHDNRGKLDHKRSNNHVS